MASQVSSDASPHAAPRWRILIRETFHRLRSAPFELLAFFFFCAATIPADIARMVWASLDRALIPYTGWVLLSDGFGMGAFLAIVLVWEAKRNGRRLLRWLMVAVTSFALLIGVPQALQPARASYNPYLAVSPYRWVWFIAVPLFWTLVLLSPRIGRFASEGVSSG